MFSFWRGWGVHTEVKESHLHGAPIGQKELLQRSRGHHLPSQSISIFRVPFALADEVPTLLGKAIPEGADATWEAHCWAHSLWVGGSCCLWAGELSGTEGRGREVRGHPWQHEGVSFEG
jgi:hypothetical protein